MVKKLRESVKVFPFLFGGFKILFYICISINQQRIIMQEQNNSQQFVHPELKEGETFLINVHPNEVEAFTKNKPPFIKKYRVGKTAYVTDGSEVVPQFVPLFGTLELPQPTLRVGDKVMWRGGFGSDAPKEAEIEAMYRVKLGQKEGGKRLKDALWSTIDDTIIVDLTNGHWARGSQLSQKDNG